MMDEDAILIAAKAVGAAALGYLQSESTTR
jgi:hypothetical protein